MRVIGNIRTPAISILEDGKETVLQANGLHVLIDGVKTEMGEVKRGDRVVKTKLLNGYLNYLELERDTHAGTGAV